MAVTGTEPISAEDLQAFMEALDPYIAGKIDQYIGVKQARWSGTLTYRGYVSSTSDKLTATINQTDKSDYIFRSGTQMMFTSAGTYRIVATKPLISYSGYGANAGLYVDIDGGKVTLQAPSGRNEPFQADFTVTKDNTLLTFYFMVNQAIQTNATITTEETTITRIE